MAQKSSGGGPRAALNKEDLAVLEQEVNLYNPVGQSEVDGVVRSWFRVYHSVVLLAAAMDAPQSRSLNKLDD